jgi:hypothetical protein
VDLLGFSDPNEKINFRISLDLCHIFQFYCKQSDTLIAVSKAQPISSKKDWGSKLITKLAIQQAF